jgi:beta-propeller repeat-containing protein
MKTRSIGLCYVSVIMVAAGLFQAQKPMAAQTLESPSDGLPLIALTSAKAAPAKVSEARRQQVAASYGKLPMSFEANRGQSDWRVKFLARGRGYSLFLTSNESVLALKRASQESKETKGASDPGPALSRSTLSESTECMRMKLVGASADELPGKANYFIGSDPKKWRTNVPTYAKVKYEAVYPGVDLIYYGNQQQLEYDFVVAAGADPKAIRLSFQGARKLSLDEQGNLVLEARHGQVRLERPQVYQEAKGERRAIDGHYVLQAGNSVSFTVASYDHRKPLVIDPALAYSTYLGGSSIDLGNDIAVDSAGSAYVTGVTLSTNFPTANALQPSSGGGADAFAAKINASGSAKPWRFPFA